MKKRKFNLLLEIATLCLCVAAIAIGVYSAKNASLNVSGTIGFEAHNCKVDVSVKLSGDGVVTNSDNEVVSSANGYVRRTALVKQAEFATDASGVVDFGDLFFADLDTINGKAAPIKMTFTITNNSAFAIKAKVTLPTDNNDVTILANKESIRIEQGTTGNVGEIMLTYTLNDPEADLTTALDLSKIKFDFTKYDFKKSDIEIKYGEINGITIETPYLLYGNNDLELGKIKGKGDPLVWIPVGIYEENNGKVSVKDAAGEYFDINVIDSVYNFKLKDDVTYIFSPLVGFDAFNISFNNNTYYNTTDKKWYSNEYPNILGSDYAISTVREYLNGKNCYTKINEEKSYNDVIKTTPDKTSTMTNMYITTELKGTADTEDIYTLIKPRTLKSLYNNSLCIYNGDYVQDEENSLEIPNIEGVDENDSDAFWLIASWEIGNNAFLGLDFGIRHYFRGVLNDSYKGITYYDTQNFEMTASSVYNPWGVRPAILI